MGSWAPRAAVPAAPIAALARQVTQCERVTDAGDGEPVPVTLEEFDALKRQVDGLRDRVGSDQMAAALTATDAARSKC